MNETGDSVKYILPVLCLMADRISMVAWQSADFDRLARQVEEFADSLKNLLGIVWRWKPELDHKNGKYRFICRLHAWPYTILDGAKEEGAPTPEATPNPKPDSWFNERIAEFEAAISDRIAKLEARYPKPAKVD